MTESGRCQVELGQLVVPVHVHVAHVVYGRAPEGRLECRRGFCQLSTPYWDKRAPHSNTPY
jgi:hypothetical protein